MAIAICAEADEGSSPSRKTEGIHRGRKLMITKTAVSVICSSTDYKQDCIASLETVRSLDPRNLIRAAFDLAIMSIRSGINRGMIDIKSRADADMHTRDALNSCWELMNFAIDDLLKRHIQRPGKDGLVIFGSDSPQEWPLDPPEGSPQMDDSSENQQLDSSEVSPQMGDSSENQRLDSSKDSPPKNLNGSKKRLLDSFENQPMDSSNDSQNLNPSKNQQTDLSESQPSDSYTTQSLDSSRNKLLDSSENTPQKLDSSESRPLDPLQKLNPLRAMNPFGKLEDRHLSEEGEFPRWVTTHSRRLLSARRIRISANVVVAKDGSGNCKKIEEALAMVPMKNIKKFVIHIKQGAYYEKIAVTKKMKNVMFVGDGPTKTIITGNVAFFSRSAPIALLQTEGSRTRPEQHAIKQLHSEFQPILLCSSTVIWMVTKTRFTSIPIVNSIVTAAFQAPSTSSSEMPKPFFKTVNLSSTVPWITSSALLQPKEGMTGVIQPGLNKAFLGRPWKEYSRKIIMNTNIDDVIDPEGWLKWNETLALNTLFYSEYHNKGRSSDQAHRVRWRGIQRISDKQARGFAPGDFLHGNAWIPKRRIPYSAY
ncbi:hypothetical protein Bca4012_066028 [Brassica carinata]